MFAVMGGQRRKDVGQPDTLRRVECRHGKGHGFDQLFRPDHSKDKGTGRASMFFQETGILIQVPRIDKTRDSHRWPCKFPLRGLHFHASWCPRPGDMIVLSQVFFEAL
jgi:hypothetical protein